MVLWFLVCLATAGLDVENGTKPVGPSKTIVFIEDLRFGGGAQDPDELIWTGVNPRISAASDGTMYVADGGSNRILVFNKQGHLQKTLGGTGEGPGEYRNLLGYWILDDGRGIGLEGRFRDGILNWYTDGVRFERTAKPNQNDEIYWMVPSPKGHLYGGRHVFVNPDRTIRISQELRRLDSFKRVKRFSQYVIPLWDGSRAQDINYLVDRFALLLRKRLAPKFLIQFDSQGRVFVGNGKTYKVERWDPHYKTRQLGFGKAYGPKIRSEAEIATILEEQRANILATVPESLRPIYTADFFRRVWERAKIPPRHNPLNAILPLPDGHVLAVSHVGPMGLTEADLFDLDGVLIGSVKVSNYGLLDTFMQPRMSFRGPFAYTIEMGEDGNYSAVRYRYRIEPSP